MRKGTTKSLDDILDVVGSADGGIQYAKFKVMLESLDYQAEHGDPASCAIIDIVKQFARLITLDAKQRDNPLDLD